MRFKPHSIKQEICIFSKKKIILLACGIQYGKTTVGALRTKMYMHTYTSKDDNFIIAAPTYKIMQQATLPAFLALMKGYGEYSKVDAVFKMHGGGTCYFRTATDPDSVVGITNVRHIWGDEAGKYPLYFHENLQARASFKQCPIIYTTSPYSLNWVYTDYIRLYQKNPQAMPDLELVQARSNENPYFPQEEYERKRATMDARRFNMIYGGEFHKLEGLVYDCFDEDKHVVEACELDPKTIFVAGVDWGYTNPSVILVLAVTPDMGTYLVHEYYKTGKTVNDLVEVAKKLKTIYNIERFYCDPSSPANIAEFNKARLTAVPANNDIRAGIDHTYEIIKADKFHVFEGRAPHFLDEISVYHYPSPQDATADKDIKEQMPVKQHDHACIAGFELVNTPNGDMCIKDIKPGDKVLTPLGYKEVIESGMTGIKDCIKITFENNSLILTGDHPIFNLKSFAFDASGYCDSVLLCDSMAKNTVLTAGIGGALVVKEKLRCIYTELFGRSTRVRYQRGIISTIKMAISTTMIYPILNVLSNLSIYPCMESATKSPLASEHWKRLQNGIEVKRELSTINGSEKSHMKRERKIRKKKSVYAAKKHLNVHINPNTARMLVSRSIAVSLRLIAWIENVPFARKLSKLINTVKPRHAPIIAKERSEKQAVYNLKVKDAACFYANGVLVSNCDAARYAFMGIRHGIKKSAPVNPKGSEIDTRMHIVDHILKSNIDHEEYDW